MGRCKGMLTPEHFNILYKAFHDTKLAGIHDTTSYPRKTASPLDHGGHRDQRRRD